MRRVRIIRDKVSAPVVKQETANSLLKGKSYRELQALAKQHNVSAGGSAKDIKARLRRVL